MTLLLLRALTLVRDNMMHHLVTCEGQQDNLNQELNKVGLPDCIVVASPTVTTSEKINCESFSTCDSKIEYLKQKVKKIAGGMAGGAIAGIVIGVLVALVRLVMKHTRKHTHLRAYTDTPTDRQTDTHTRTRTHTHTRDI